MSVFYVYSKELLNDCQNLYPIGNELHILKQKFWGDCELDNNGHCVIKPKEYPINNNYYEMNWVITRVRKEHGYNNIIIEIEKHGRKDTIWVLENLKLPLWVKSI